MTTASLMASRVLEKFVNAQVHRATFDPANVGHRITYLQFRETGKWSGGCPFKLEWPFLTVPALCQGRLLDYYLTQDNELHK